MPSHKSFAAATASRTGLPSFSASASTLVKSNCSMVLKSWSGARSYSPDAARRSMRTCNTTISASFSPHAPQRGFQVIQRVIRAHRNQNISGGDADAGGRQFGFLREIELIEFHVGGASGAHAHAMLGNFEHREKQNRENDARDGCLRLRKQVDHRDRQQHQRDQPEARPEFPCRKSPGLSGTRYSRSCGCV